ncbi:MAG: T9SS type A sorting domain-containing protein, partial [Chitinophagaceae bacterium]
SNGEYFAGFLPSTSTSSYNSGRVYIKKGSAGNTFALGTSPAIASTTPVFYSPVDYAVGATHLVTLAYVIVPGANNDTSKLFVNKPFSSTEPLPDAVSPYTAAAAVESVDVSRFFIRQAVTSGRTTPNADLDGIKISLNYADAALPLTLTSFKARLVEKFVQLNWTSVNEENVRSYTIERSNDGRNFASIGQVSARNTNQASYLFSDNAPIQGIGYYRLKMTDNDGDTKLSAIVSINSRKKISAEVYPNPVVDNISVSHSKAAIGASIKIYNTSGQQVKSVTVQPGTIQTSLLVNELIKGNYVLAFDNDGESTVTKFIKK